MIGKLLGGTIGFVLLGPLGAIAGVALGDFFEEQNRRGHGRPEPTMEPKAHELEQQYFLSALSQFLENWPVQTEEFVKKKYLRLNT